MIKIGLDIMGGDFAPNATLEGVFNALKIIPDTTKLVLYGDEEQIVKVFKEKSQDLSKVEIVSSRDEILMSDHPAKAFMKKQNSSIALGFKDLQLKKIKAYASAGNTGAMLVGAMYTVKQIPGIIRPCITGPLPKTNGKFTVLLDVGINPDCRPDVLLQYAILGSLYSKHVYNIENPKIALLNIGSEPEKGNLLAKATYDLLKDNVNVNFVGNIEGNQLFSEDFADVVITDGFTGNVMIKQAESFYKIIKERNISDKYFDKFNPESYGGTPILGINGNAIIGHGASNSESIKNMILLTNNVAEADLTNKIKETFKNV